MGKEHDHKGHDDNGNDEEAKGLDEAAAKELIGHALRLLRSEEAAAEAAPLIEAAIELARHSSRAAGNETLSITGITVWPDGIEEGSNTTVFSHGQQVGAKAKREPVAYGGTKDGMNYECVRTPVGSYVCASWK